MKRTFLLLTLLLLTACKPSVEKLNNNGNESFAEEDYPTALETYRGAQVEYPDIPEPYYNAANTYYRQENYQQANLQSQQALRNAEDDLAQNSFYNLGNTYFQNQEYEPAVEAFKQALRLTPGDQDAKYNLELALQQLQEQKDQQQQEQEQQDNQEEQEEQEEQEQEQEQQDNQEKQEQEQEQQNQQQSEQDQNPQQQDAQQEQQEQQNNDQPANEQLTQEQARQLLEAIAKDAESLQQRLQQIPTAPGDTQGDTPAEDW